MTKVRSSATLLISSPWYKRPNSKAPDGQPSDDQQPSSYPPDDQENNLSFIDEDDQLHNLPR